MYRPRFGSYSKSKYRRTSAGYSSRKSGYSRGSSTARALGSARASKSGSKLDYFNCTVTGNCQFTRGANNYYSNVVAFYPNIGGIDPASGIVMDADMGDVHGGLVNDRSFRLKCAQFDEYRIVSMKIKMNISNDDDGTMTLCSITDRQADREEVQMDDSAMTDTSSDVPSFREVCESQGSIKTIINKNRITPIIRTIYARDMREKTDYTDCTIEYNGTPNQSPTEAITMQNFPVFSPATYFCIQFSTATTTPKTFTFGYTVEYNIIFRNPKSDIQTFIIQENPSRVNPEPPQPTPGRDDDNNRALLAKGITVVKSGDPYIPDMIMRGGRETNISWLNRYKARVALRGSKKITNPNELFNTSEKKSSSPTKSITDLLTTTTTTTPETTKTTTNKTRIEDLPTTKTPEETDPEKEEEETAAA